MFQHPYRLPITWKTKFFLLFLKLTKVGKSNFKKSLCLALELSHISHHYINVTLTYMYHKCYAKLGPNLQPSLTGFPLFANAVFVCLHLAMQHTKLSGELTVSNLLKLRMDVEIAWVLMHVPKQPCFQSYEDFLIKGTSPTLLKAGWLHWLFFDLVKEERSSKRGWMVF